MKFQLPNGVYDVLKWLCIVFLPAFSTLYWSFASIWAWPYAEQILGSIAAVETFIGALIGISHVNYYKDNGNTDEI